MCKFLTNIFIPSFEKKRKPPKFPSKVCTQTRGRTGMEVNPLVFETSASTDSAIWAIEQLFVPNCGAKVEIIFDYSIHIMKKII